MKTALITLLTCLTVMTQTHQLMSQSHLNLHLGLANPIGDFASDDLDDEDAGGAGPGFNLGLQYVYQFTESGLGVFTGLDFNINGLKGSAKDEIEDYYESQGFYGVDHKYYKYINVPLTFGLHYRFSANDKFGLIANGGLAVNYLKVTDWEIEYLNQEITTEFDPTTSIGVKIGGGIILNERITFKLDYLGLGKCEIDGVIKSPGFPSERFESELKVNLINFTFGVWF